MNGNLNLGVLGNSLPGKASGGGGSVHDKGFYADESALVLANPTGEAGDWAIVGDTDSIWVWDTDTSAWVNSKYSPAHAKGWFTDPASLMSSVPSGVAGDWAIVGSTDTVWVWDTDTNAWIDTGQGSIVNWGDIGGTLSVQADLQAALDNKENLLEVMSQTVYVDSVGGSPTGRGSITAPFKTAYEAIQWIESPTGGNDSGHAQYWTIKLAPGTYPGTDFPVSTISIPDKITIEGAGESTIMTGRVNLNQYSAIDNLKVELNNCGTNGIVRVHDHFALIRNCLLTSTRFSGGDFVGIDLTGGGNHVNVIGTRIKLYNNVASSVTVTGIRNATQDNYAFGCDVFFGANSEANENYITKVPFDEGTGSLTVDYLTCSCKYDLDYAMLLVNRDIYYKDSDPVTVTVDTTVDGIYDTVLSNGSVPLVHTLKPSSQRRSRPYSIVNTGSVYCTIQADGAETINGYTSVIVDPGDTVTLRPIAGGWVLI